MSDTLVLTPAFTVSNFLPLSVVDWQTTIRLMCLDKVRPVHLYEDRWIRSPKLSIQLPAVVVTTDSFVKKQTEKFRFSRQLLFLRDLYQCQYCGEQFSHRELTVDHVLPKCQGGKSGWMNSVSACHPCNHHKGHQRWTPINKPWVPDYYALAAKRLELPIHVSHESWIPYLKVGNKTAKKVVYSK